MRLNPLESHGARAAVNALAALVGVAGMIVASLPLTDGWHRAGIGAMIGFFAIEAVLVANGLMMARRGRGS